MRLPADVQAAIKKQLPKLIKRPFRRDVDKRFKSLKDKMIKEFLNHRITKEIQEGPQGSASGSLNGVTNLFAFIGFDDGDDPIAPILTIFENIKITQDTEYIQKGVGRKYKIDFPTAQEIFDVTPMPWAIGRSWAQGIEVGISGLGYLLRKKAKGSRSGVAIQSSKQVRSAKFKNTKYISALINKYKKRFDKLK